MVTLKDRLHGYLHTHHRWTLLKLLRPALAAGNYSHEEMPHLTEIGQNVGLSLSEVGALTGYSRGKIALYCSTVLLFIVVTIFLLLVANTFFPPNNTTYIAGTRYGSIAPKDFR